MDNSVSTVKKFYTLGSTTVAVRTVSGTEDVLNWVLGDHYGAQRSTPVAQRRGLGSASVTANADGSWNSELKYTAFGEVRTSRGLTPTEYRYTGQMEAAELGLYFYVARWYDPYLTHFIQADSIVPGFGDVKAYNRYSYVKYNSVNYIDPTGHFEFEDSPNDSYFVSAFPGIHPARRYETEAVSEEEAVKIFIASMSDPGVDIVQSDGFLGVNTLGGPGYHPAVDFASTRDIKKGTPISSVLPGNVVEVSTNRNGSFGLYAVVEHDIHGYKFYSVYAHLDETTVAIGQLVSEGDKLGGMGNTPFHKGEKPGAIHLHFEVRSERHVKFDENQISLMRNSNL